MKYMLLALLGLGVFVPPVHARPVSYPGGWTFITENDADKNAALLHYTFTPKTAVGYRLEHRRGTDATWHALQVNHLLRRWNGRDSQANVYLESRFGVLDNGAASVAGFAGMAADWENRRLFVSYRNGYTDAGPDDSAFTQAARMGVAPYVGGYGDLHTWIMIEVRHMPESKDPVTVAPLVRFFKGVHLVEAGMDNKGKALFNYTFRY